MAMKTTREVKGVGLSIPRPDGPEKVTGQTQYVADIKPRGLLHAKLLRSPHAHARIVRIDATRARALPGVRAVLTAADIPELKRKPPTRAHAVLAIDRAVFAGQPVAAVAADEPAIAEEALDLIEVQYEVLPVAVDPLLSMRPGAPPVADAGTEADTSEALAHSGVAAAKTEAGPARAVNVAQQSHLSRGDVAKGFAESRWSTRATSSRTPSSPSGTAAGCSPSGPARRARSTRARRSPTSSGSPRTGSG
jgi:CO/xanthine dehydrogenase Mo-binding subunit